MSIGHRKSLLHRAKRTKFWLFEPEEEKKPNDAEALELMHAAMRNKHPVAMALCSRVTVVGTVSTACPWQQSGPQCCDRAW